MVAVVRLGSSSLDSFLLLSFRGQRGNAVGFKLLSLTRISDTKSSCNKNVTLLHYIVDTCECKVQSEERMLGP